MAFNPEDQELIDSFLTESTELLEKLDDDLLLLEKNPGDTEMMNRIFRTIHTIKGSASFLEFAQLVAVAHKTEDVLNRLRHGELHLTPELTDVILAAIDLVKQFVADIRGGELVEREIEPTIAALLPFLAADYQAAAPPAIPTANEPGADCPAPVIPPVAPAPPPPAIKAGKGAEPAKAAEEGDNSTVRVDVKRLDDLMNQVGELVLERNRMVQLNADHVAGVGTEVFSGEFSKLAKRLNFVTSELQSQVMKMRMFPVEKVFKKFPRIVRNLARDLGKQVDLQIYGEETELDRSVVDEIGDPLVHLLRNAMDHGLETPAERLAAGKSPTGTLVLGATHEGNHILISIKDDGRGIDPVKVGKKAVERGLVSEEQLAGLTPRDIYDFLFLPGFSTKEQTTDLSGRGVGMDVVRTNIKKLNGVIDIKSELGAGSEFILRLPLTLAIIQSLLVEVGSETYCIPLSAVLETVKADSVAFHTVGEQEVLRLRDTVLPVVRLHSSFGVGGAAAADPANDYVVVVGIAEKRLALLVSRLLGQQEVAIKSLGRILANLGGIAGSTILGDGRVALIVDPAGLLAN